MGGLLRALEQLPACRQRWFARATASQGEKIKFRKNLKIKAYA